MSKFNVISNIEVPATTRNRARGEFANTVDSLEVGQGFHFESKGKLQSQYAKVSPKKFDGKKFKVWMVGEGEGTDGANIFGVARLADNATDHVDGEDSGEDGDE